jgi:hypothetical protein
MLKNQSETNLKINLEHFKRKFKNNQKTCRLLFGRKDFNSQSLFEYIITLKNLAESDHYDSFLQILNYIWNEFGLKDKPEILIMVSYLLKIDD